jgi:DNA-directed RNA polymerase subunit beta'
MMANSGARGSRTQIGSWRVCADHGYTFRRHHRTADRANFKEGLSIIVFFISTNGARKGLAETALKQQTPGTSRGGSSTSRWKSW